MGWTLPLRFERLSSLKISRGLLGFTAQYILHALPPLSMSIKEYIARTWVGHLGSRHSHSHEIFRNRVYRISRSRSNRQNFECTWLLFPSTPTTRSRTTFPPTGVTTKSSLSHDLYFKSNFLSEVILEKCNVHGWDCGKKVWISPTHNVVKFTITR